MLFVVRYFFKKKQFFNTEIRSSPQTWGEERIDPFTAHRASGRIPGYISPRQPHRRCSTNA